MQCTVDEFANGGGIGTWDPSGRIQRTEGSEKIKYEMGMRGWKIMARVLRDRI